MYLKSVFHMILKINNDYNRCLLLKIVILLLLLLLLIYYYIIISGIIISLQVPPIRLIFIKETYCFLCEV